MKKYRLITRFVLILYSINLVAMAMWVFSFDTIRIVLLSFSGIGLYILFFIYAKQKTAYILKAVSILLVILGFINSSDRYVYSLIFDICFIGIIGSVFLLKDIEKQAINRFFYVIAMCFICYYIYVIPKLNYMLIFSGSSITRESTFHFVTSADSEYLKEYLIYLTQSMFVNLLLILLLIYPLIRIKNKVLDILIFTLIFTIILLYSIYYVKRQPFLELGIVLFIYFFFYKKIAKGIIPSNILIRNTLLISIILVILSANITSTITERFGNLIQNISEFDRLEETQKVFSEFDYIDYIFGRGLGVITSTAFSAGNTLHIGYANLIFKGGVILLLFYISQFAFNFLYCYKRSQTESKYYIIGSGISLFAAISLFYTPGYYWTINTIVVPLGMFSRYPLKAYFNSIFSSQKSILNKNES
ncbi:hypothetical protein AAG747_24670 [Rapidithrix thailandica]|uniref:Uncharacterized protein n=1 Tax=Rapidithrix thailandica TaxID=413964 RepID=A0AAW9SDY2_9BACT